MPHHLSRAALDTDRSTLAALNTEYLGWVLDQLGTPPEQALGEPLATHVAHSLDSLCGVLPPQGGFHLLWVDGEVAGMGGWRHLGQGVAELKRIYLRPGFQGRGLARPLVEHLLAEARAAGHRHACLDSAPFMAAAHRCYAALGFVDRAPYPGTDAPAEFHDRWRFMARDL